MKMPSPISNGQSNNGSFVLTRTSVVNLYDKPGKAEGKVSSMKNAVAPVAGTGTLPT